MDLIHSFSNLETETLHPHSSSSHQKEVNRNWLEIPADVLSMIFLKLGTNDILVGAQWVCSSWWKLCKQPHLFRRIHVEPVFSLFGSRIWVYSILKLSRELAREAIDRSCGQLVEFSVKHFADDELMQYMSKNASSLRCLRLVNEVNNVTHQGLIDIARILTQLEELEITHFSRGVLKLFPSDYQSYNLTGTEFDGVALAIAANMSELRHLNLSGNEVTDDGLQAILDGCPHLETLDLWECFLLRFEGDLKERCGNIKVSRLPNVPS